MPKQLAKITITNRESSGSKTLLAGSNGYSISHFWGYGDHNGMEGNFNDISIDSYRWGENKLSGIWVNQNLAKFEGSLLLNLRDWDVRSELLIPSVRLLRATYQKKSQKICSISYFVEDFDKDTIQKIWDQNFILY